MIEIDTEKAAEVVDITRRVNDAVRETGVDEGICLVYARHTTTAIVINEGEGGLVADLLEKLSALAPPGDGYHHDTLDENAHAHLQAALLGNSKAIPVEDGRLVLGTWQRVLFVELDGPRQRTVSVKVVPC
ncbi:secondary thiamine-phosphate synthase enzyme YjbQ [Methanotrichaceae archaeon M04Ac]|jgi:secondary thiamine-phosphate synthase enzyme|uniref:Secondary thiamine-phosphate synthase enzyme YjbQ n=1 Tax=Candidatus Methanocrinis alkalitolerans TaxID=3033395 RepID=A0ABT5XHK9_9EURY|nr:secondary thiamine-phosphate synthase enzyme YjbQ [Candidatus Methanocrinis alkalitolerans]MCR3884162.1 secondary thiamine-phosphate synthase enzyme YjbQ [Methanothrix sp.]MDF0594189.1 secondary thiamine-phosphate synthase enzyme YjbQ [Candidatus Methanocrinis alkalitolerans]